MRRALASAVVAVGIALVACSGDDATASISPEAACDDAANAYCAKVDECAPFFVKLAFGDVASCVARIKINCVPGFSATGTSATPARLSQCATDVKGSSCEDTLGRKLPESCRTEPGALDDGAACGVDAQCKGKLCRLASGGTCGACSSLGAAGSACERDEDCDAALGCAEKRCVAFGGAGAPCSAKSPCLRSLACANGTCAAPIPAGGACTPSQDGSQNPCDGAKGYFCHGQTKVCTQVGVAAAGATCGFVDGTIVLCSGGAECKTTPPAVTGTCQAAAADGATCDDTKGPKCIAPARCAAGVCKITDPSSCK